MLHVLVGIFYVCSKHFLYAVSFCLDFIADILIINFFTDRKVPVQKK
jgi:hypothetical protein